MISPDFKFRMLETIADASAIIVFAGLYAVLHSTPQPSILSTPQKPRGQYEGVTSDVVRMVDGYKITPIRGFNSTYFLVNKDGRLTDVVSSCSSCRPFGPLARSHRDPTKEEQEYVNLALRNVL